VSRKKKKFLAWGLLSYASAQVGSALNQIVVMVNGGRMPVYYGFLANHPFIIDARHEAMTAASKLKFLCDYIQYGGYINSPGDMMIDMGEISLAVFIITLILVGFRSLKD
jgi:hypothetical protein